MKYDIAARVSFFFIQPLGVYCVIDCIYILLLLVRCGFLTINELAYIYFCCLLGVDSSPSMNLYCTVTIPYHVVS